MYMTSLFPNDSGHYSLYGSTAITIQEKRNDTHSCISSLTSPSMCGSTPTLAFDNTCVGRYEFRE